MVIFICLEDPTRVHDDSVSVKERNEYIVSKEDEGLRKGLRRQRGFQERLRAGVHIPCNFLSWAWKRGPVTSALGGRDMQIPETHWLASLDKC